ncbi:MAG: bifunctional DNA primase/polymerase [Pirellulales bacterium]
MATAPNPLLIAALRYAELGYAVFPCAPGDSTPLTEHGFHDATTDAEQIEAWWSAHPSANIAIAAAGLLVVDVDPLDNGSANTWLRDEPEKLLALSAAPTAITPRGGRHHVFHKPTGKAWRCGTSVLAPHVDVRTDGGYIVVAPSRRREGSYSWVRDIELDVTPDRLLGPPAWLVAQLDRVGTTSPTSPRVAAGPERANPIPSGQRNATLARLGGAMRRVGMSQGEISAALDRVNRDRCVPPLAPAEVERIAVSVARYSPDEVSVALAENHYDQMYAEAPADEVASDDPGPISDDLLRVPGYIDEVMAYTLDTAPYPERVMAFCGALALQAVLAGRKIRDPMGNRTNLYILGLANSGVGKDHARQVNQRILYETGLADCLGNSFASGEGIEDRLFVQPAVLYQVDEIDGLLLRVSQAKDARHEQIVSMLLQMYSSARGVYVMRAKAGRERTAIDQPSLSIFGTAVPKQFYEALSRRLLTNGFLARMIVLECRRRGSGREDGDRPLPASILDVARWWAEFRPGGAPGNLSDWHPDPRLVPQTDDAREQFRQLREQADQAYTRAESRNDTVAMAIWARAYEKARRLALLYACSVNHIDPIISPDAVAWAGAFVDHQTRRMLFMAGYHASESEFDSKRKRLLEVLSQWREQHGDEWMPFWRINRRLPWSSREHEEVRATLLEQRLIEAKRVQTRGRPGAVYRLLPSSPSEEDSS